MSDWKESYLNEVLLFGNGKKKPDSTGTIPIFGGNGILGYSNESNYDQETIIIGRVGAYCGSVYYENQPIWVSDNALSAKPKEENSAKFLYYFLKDLNLNRYASGSSHPLITQTILNSLEFKICKNPNHQRAIAEVLSSLDDKIDLFHRQNQTLEAMADTLFRQWFVKEGEEAGILSDIVDLNPTYKLSKGQVAPYLDMKNVSSTSFAPDGWYDRDFTSGMRFKNGDTLLARITPCLQNGKSCFVSFLQDEQVGWGSTEYIVIRMKEGFHPFISYLIANDSHFRDFAIGSMSGSSGRQRAQASSLANYKIKLPSPQNLDSLNEQLTSFINKMNNNALQIKTLESLRDTLLPKLMSGEVTVSIDE